MLAPSELQVAVLIVAGFGREWGRRGRPERRSDGARDSPQFRLFHQLRNAAVCSPVLAGRPAFF